MSAQTPPRPGFICRGSKSLVLPRMDVITHLLQEDEALGGAFIVRAIKSGFTELF